MLRLSDEELEILREAQVNAKRRIARCPKPDDGIHPISIADMLDMKRQAECGWERGELNQSTPNPVGKATRPRKGL